VNQKIHPQTIIEGYRIATAAAFKALEASSADNGYLFFLIIIYCFKICLSSSLILIIVVRNNPEVFRKDLINIARTTLSSKVLSQDKDYFANLAVDAVRRLKVSFNSIKYLKILYIKVFIFHVIMLYREVQILNTFK